MPKPVSHVSPLTGCYQNTNNTQAILSDINIDDVSKILGETSSVSNHIYQEKEVGPSSSGCRRRAASRHSGSRRFWR